MAKTFVNTFMRWCAPAWLTAGDGGKVIESLLYTIDDADERARLGMVMRFPSYAVGIPGALAEIGKSRGIMRGRTETDEHYAGRLIRWRFPRGHRVRGNGFALAEQVSEYWGKVAVYTIDRRGNKCQVNADGSDAFTQGVSWTWDTAPTSPRWARFWIVIDGRDFATPQLEWADPDLWGGTFPALDFTVGQLGVTPYDVDAMRDLVPASGMSWKPFGTMPEWIVVNLSADPVVPNSDWKYWSVIIGGVQVPSRSQDCRYWSLRPEVNNVYSGRVQYCNAAAMPDGSEYAGDPDNFPSPVPMPDGSTYKGDATKFPVSVQLIDDGDPIR